MRSLPLPVSKEGTQGPTARTTSSRTQRPVPHGQQAAGVRATGPAYEVWLGNHDEGTDLTRERGFYEAVREGNWRFVGRATQTRTFEIIGAYSHVILAWREGGLHFDAIDNPLTGASVGFNRHGDPVGGYRQWAGVMAHPENIVGPPDGRYATALKLDGRGRGPGYVLLRLGELIDGWPGRPDQIRVTLVRP